MFAAAAAMNWCTSYTLVTSCSCIIFDMDDTIQKNVFCIASIIVFHTHTQQQLTSQSCPIFVVDLLVLFCLVCDSCYLVATVSLRKSE